MQQLLLFGIQTLSLSQEAHHTQTLAVACVYWYEDCARRVFAIPWRPSLSGGNCPYGSSQPVLPSRGNDPGLESRAAGFFVLGPRVEVRFTSSKYGNAAPRGI